MSRKEQKYILQNEMRITHEKKILLALLHYGPLSRGDLAKHLQITVTSISNVTQRLLLEGWIIEEEIPSPKKVGRPAQSLLLNKNALFLPVASLTAKGLRLEVFDLQMNPISSHFFPYPQKEFLCKNLKTFNGFSIISAQVFVGFFLSCIHNIPTKQREKAPAFLLSLPGSFLSDEPYFLASPLPFGIEGDFLSILSSQLGKPFIYGNDSSFYAYSQKNISSPQESFIYINIHEGVGAGTIYQGNLFPSNPSSGTELGHLSIDYNGLPCRCGGCGCLERYISFPALMQQAQPLYQQQMTIEEIAQDYQKGNPQILPIMENMAQKLSRAISSMLALIEVDAVVLGGGIELFGQGFLHSLQNHMAQYPVRYGARNIPISYANKKNDSYGAAKYYFEQLWNHHL